MIFKHIFEQIYKKILQLIVEFLKKKNLQKFHQLFFYVLKITPCIFFTIVIPELFRKNIQKSTLSLNFCFHTPPEYFNKLLIDFFTNYSMNPPYPIYRATHTKKFKKPEMN